MASSSSRRHDWEPRPSMTTSASKSNSRSRSSRHRAKSTNTRLMSGPPLRREITVHHKQQQQPHHERPRPISTGRILTQQQPSPYRRSKWKQEPSPVSPRAVLSPNNNNGGSSQCSVSSSQDPDSVTRAILDLREKREQAQSRRMQRESQHPIHYQSSFLDHSNGRLQNNTPSNKLHNQSNKNNTTMAEKEASARLQTAHGTISNIKQELDEVKFFHEIEAESPPTRKSPRPQRKDLSPRRIASMDRTDLELQVQTLVRENEILRHRRDELAQQTKALELQVASNGEAAGRIQVLEDALGTVQEELDKSMTGVRQGRAQLQEEYQAKLQRVQKKLQLSSADIIALENQLQERDAALDKLRTDTANRDKRHQQEEKEKEQSYEQQLAELTMQLETATQTIQDQTEALDKLQHEITSQNETLQETQDKLQAELTRLQAELTTAKDRNEELETHDQVKDAELAVLKDQLQHAQTERATAVEALQEQLASVKDAHHQEIQDARRIQEEKEGRRLEELVGAQQTEVQEYERRILALQEQLTLSRERHANDIEQKQQEMDTRLQQKVEAARRDIFKEHQALLSSVQEELAKANQRYEEAAEENMRRQVEFQTKDRDVVREWERKASFSHVEVERLKDEVDRATRELTEKQTKLSHVQERMAEAELRHAERLEEVQAQHAEDLAAREEMVSLQRQRFKGTETKLRADVARKDAELTALQESSLANTTQLQQELLEAQQALAEAKTSVSDLEQEQKRQLQNQLSHSKEELVSERARHEALEGEWRVELAKLEGKLSAAESTLKEKRTAIELLEERLAVADEESSAVGSKLQHDVMALKRDLNTTRELLQQEQAANQEKEEELQDLVAQLAEQQGKLESVKELETIISTTRKSVELLSKQKASNEEELDTLKEKHEAVVEKLVDMERQWDDTNDSEELKRVEEEFRKSTESLTATISSLEDQLESKTRDTFELREQLEEMKNALETARQESASNESETNQLQATIMQLEETVRTQRSQEQPYPETLQELEERLADSEESLENTARELKRVQDNKAEVDDAVEQLIQEVSHRDEELDSLTAILEKREEELEHAKTIATKAIASAQEIKSYYQERTQRDSTHRRQVEFAAKVEELSASVDYLTGKNENLKNQQSKLETELQEKNVQVARLKDELRARERQEKKMRSYESSPTSSTSRERGFTPLHDDGFIPMDDKKSNGFPSIREHHSEEEGAFGSARQMDDSMSTETANLGEATQWLHDFDVESRSSDFASVDTTRSEPGMKSRRAIERDALKRYVRKRYLKKSTP